MSGTPRYWFPAKKYGWGWGPPVAWQGWAVLVVFAVLLALGVVFFPPARGVAPFLLYSFALAAVLVLVCWLKGEPPRWRWGEDGKDR